MAETVRQIVLDTETTGLEPSQGHRIIEIGCVELLDRRLSGSHFHEYLNPDRVIDEAAIEVHGISNESLADQPHFPDIAQKLADYLRGAEVIIHNAPFDLGFLDAEFARLDEPYRMQALCEITDTLVMARQMHPGQRNSLDALCGRYDIANAHRTKHGALLDAEILADVYLAMTGGQRALVLDMDSGIKGEGASNIRRLAVERKALPVVLANPAELAAHQDCLQAIHEVSGGKLVWPCNDPV